MSFAKELIVPGAVVVFWVAYFVDTWGMPAQTTVYPYFLMIAMPLIGLGVLFEVRRKPSAAAEPISLESLRRPGMILGLSLAYLVLFALAGFLIASILFLVASMLAFRVRLQVALAVAVLFTGSLYLLFTEIFVLRI